MENKFNPQTTFGYGEDHFSRFHEKHEFGSKAPIQRDFGLNMPDGSFKPLCGVESPVGTTVQLKLPPVYNGY